jgi:hypothetical protein
MSTVDAISVKIGADVKEFERALSSATKKVAAWSSATAAAALAVTAAIVKSGLSSADALAKQASAADASVVSMQALHRAAGLAGVSTNEMTSATEKLNRALGLASDENSEAAKTLESLGLELEHVLSLDADERFAAISDSMTSMGMSSADAAVMLRSLGIQQASMINLMRAGGDAIRDSRTEIEKMGIALSDIDAKKIEAANDAMSELATASKGFSQHLAVQFSPLLEEISNQLKQQIIDYGGVDKAARQAFQNATTGAKHLLNAIHGLHVILKFSEAVANSLFVYATGGMKLLLDAARLVTVTIIKGFESSIKVINKAIAAFYDLRISLIEGRKNSVDFFDSVAKNGEKAANVLIRAINKIPKINIGEIESDGNAAEDLKNRLTGKQEKLEEDKLWSGFDETPFDLSALYDETPIDAFFEIFKERMENAAAEVEELLETTLYGDQFIDWIDGVIEAADLAAQGVIDANEKIKESNQSVIDDAKRGADRLKAISEMKKQNERNMLAFSQSQSKALFSLHKVNAIGTAVMEGWEAAVSSYKAGAKIGGPPVGAAFAAMSVAATASMIANIRSSSPSGGGGGSVSAPASMPAAASSSAPAARDAPSSAAGGTLTVQGIDPGSIFTGEFVAQLAEDLLDYQRKGGSVVFAA